MGKLSHKNGTIQPPKEYKSKELFSQLRAKAFFRKINQEPIEKVRNKFLTSMSTV
jgi:hypothetical protein